MEPRPDPAGIISKCPCGREFEVYIHVRQEGLLDGKGNAAIEIPYQQSLRFCAITQRSFCSAECSLRWHNFMEALNKHVHG
jgi:hypothetical protein